MAGGLLARDNDLSKNFTVQDKRGTWAWADAKIDLRGQSADQFHLHPEAHAAHPRQPRRHVRAQDRSNWQAWYAALAAARPSIAKPSAVALRRICTYAPCSRDHSRGLRFASSFIALSSAAFALLLPPAARPPTRYTVSAAGILRSPLCPALHPPAQAHDRRARPCNSRIAASRPSAPAGLVGSTFTVTLPVQ